MNMMIASVWIAAFLLGAAVGILAAAFIPGWSRPYRQLENTKLRDDMLAADSQLDVEPDLHTQKCIAENSRLLRFAMQGDRDALDQLGVRAGRVTMYHRPNLLPWETQALRDHASDLYNIAVDYRNQDHPNETEPDQRIFLENPPTRNGNGF